MKSLKILMAGLSLAGFFAVASPASAAADTWTAYFTIDGLNNGDDSASLLTLIVSSSGGDFSGASSNPHGCTQTNYAMMRSNLGSATKDLLNRVLLAAYMAGKPVRLHMSGTLCTSAGVAGTGTTGYPTFDIVEVHD